MAAMIAHRHAVVASQVPGLQYVTLRQRPSAQLVTEAFYCKSRENNFSSQLVQLHVGL